MLPNEPYKVICAEPQGSSVVIGVNPYHISLKLSVKEEYDTVQWVIQKSQRAYRTRCQGHIFHKVVGRCKGQISQSVLLPKFFQVNTLFAPYRDKVIIPLFIVSYKEIFCLPFRVWEVDLTQLLHIENSLVFSLFIGNALGGEVFVYFLFIHHQAHFTFAIFFSL